MAPKRRFGASQLYVRSRGEADMPTSLKRRNWPMLFKK